jgi:hypothetical protein
MPRGDRGGSALVVSAQESLWLKIGAPNQVSSKHISARADPTSGQSRIEPW